jgi:hypothetical protein
MFAGARFGPAICGRSRKEKHMTQNEKKEWKQPELTVLGNVETLTLAKSKQFGTSDGFVFNNTGISG